MSAKVKPKILVLGGGFGGLESAFYLRMRMPTEADITLVSDKDYFVFKPNTIYVPFGLDPQKLKVHLDHPTKHKNIALVNSTVRDIDPISKLVSTETDKLPYDYLVVATGSGMRPEEVPGLAEHAQTVWTTLEMLRLKAAFNKLYSEAKGGARQRVLFLVPPNNSCSGPLYEIAFMLDTWLRRKGVRKLVSITWSTYEKSYIEAFGPRLHDVVAEEFEEHGIVGYPDFEVQEVREREVEYRNGQKLAYDLLVSFPPFVAGAMFPALPVDARGFISTDMETRQVTGYPDVYAVGDAGDFPVKQAFLAFLQADASGEHLSSQVLGTASAAKFTPVSLQMMEQFDKSTFAQVPVARSERAEQPLEIQAAASSLYRVGSSPIWRLGKKLLGVYLPWRFDAGNPFRAGRTWEGMELGLREASQVLTS